MPFLRALPAWKIRREWERLRQQAGQWHWYVAGPARKSLYEFRRRSLVNVSQGDHPRWPDVAIVLIYQPKGVLSSLLTELQHLSDNGFSPVVVSNLPVSDEDLALLKPLCHLIIQRPNFGYDFGGYREGILTVLDQAVPIRNLVVKNDSVWFPLVPDCDLLDRARNSSADLYGIYLNEYRRKPQRTHLQSYFYRFGPRLVRSAEFRTYWRNLWLTDNKHMVIRQCEMKLTEWFRTRGRTIEALYTLSDLQAALKSLTDEELYEVLRYHVQVDTRSFVQLQNYIDNPGLPGWRSAVDALIDTEALGRYLMIAHPLPLIAKLNCPVLKKDRQPMYQLQRAELARTGILEKMTDAVRAEILSWDRA